MIAFEDPEHPGNGPEHRSGLTCYGGIRGGPVVCDEPAGTMWSPYWCHACNVRRMRNIGATFDKLLEGL